MFPKMISSVFIAFRMRAFCSHHLFHTVRAEFLLLLFRQGYQNSVIRILDKVMVMSNAVIGVNGK